MTTFKSIVAAGVIAAATLTATGANALFLSGTFSITAYNYNPTGSDTQRSTRSQASQANFEAISTGSPEIGTSVFFDTFEYSGALDFRVGGNLVGDGITTIAEFLGTGAGTLTTGTGNLDRDFDPTFGSRTNSAGEGNGDGGTTGKFITTTLYKITAKSLNISDLSLLDFVRHDDGVTFLGSGVTSVASVGPNSEKVTNLAGLLSGGKDDFVLYYASANGDPSVLEVNAIPLPAAAWLLLGVSGALVAAKRRKTRGGAAA